MHQKRDNMISIIIPVYNAEEEIKDCLDSIIKENDVEFEIIAIDDGSKDNSLKILNEYAIHDNRIHVVYQENMGNSITREKGIQLAKGEFIYFVDADDKIETDTLKNISSHLSDDLDILVFGYSIDYIKENYSKIVSENPGTFSNAREYILTQCNLYPLWNKVYNANLIRNHHDFPNMKTTGQDLIFNCNVFSRAKKIKVIDDILYHYIKRPKETMVTRYILDGYANLKNKEKAIKSLIDSCSLIECQLYYDYMTAEYEVYVMNMFSNNCPLSFKKKINEVKLNVLNKEAKYIISKGSAPNSYRSLFKTIVSFNSAFVLVSCYTFLAGIRNNFSPLYVKIRKRFL